jgi:HEAT repeat protein
MSASELESMILALNDGREGVRRFAIRRLTQIGLEAVPHLIEALKDKHGFTHDGAVSTLTAIGAPAIPELIANLNHDDREVRWGVATVLGALREEGARAAVDSAMAEAKAS